MSKTLAIILNHNLPEYTDWLYYALKDHQKESYDLIVVDNGSGSKFIPTYTHVRFEKNLFWGGALNKAFEMVLESDKYDSLCFLNNDIELNPEIFIKSLRKTLFEEDYAILSPCIAGRPNPWKQMQNWASRNVRDVKWIDMQAPIFHRKIIEEIRQFDDALFYGWGQELVCYDVCHKNNWKTGVCDHLSILHFGKQTVLQNRLFSLGSEDKKTSHGGVQAVEWKKYRDEAFNAYTGYFGNIKIGNESLEDLRTYGKEYSYNISGNNNKKFLNIVKSIFKHKYYL